MACWGIEECRGAWFEFLSWDYEKTVPYRLPEHQQGRVETVPKVPVAQTDRQNAQVQLFLNHFTGFQVVWGRTQQFLLAPNGACVTVENLGPP